MSYKYYGRFLVDSLVLGLSTSFVLRERFQ